MIKEAVPGNIRKAEHFVAFLKRFVEYMKVGLLLPYIGSVLRLIVLVDTDAGATCRRGDAAVVFAASQGYHVYRA